MADHLPEIKISEQEQLIQTLNHSNKIILRNLSFWENLKMGFIRALGATLGLALFFAILGFLIKVLGGLPVVGEWLIKLGQFLHQ